MIACDNLTKHYGRLRALNRLSLSIEPGVIGLLGPNGAGKTTLISVLLGQTPLSDGDASVLGLDVKRHYRCIRQRVGFMPENACLVGGMSGMRYVYYTARLAGMRHGDAMQRAHEVLDYVGLEEARYRPADQYSTGMHQRLKLAQALVHDPDLLFLDEPTNGMDPAGREVMLELIRDLGHAGISVLLSSHLLPDVERVCQRVVILGGGERLASGDMAEMRAPHPTLCSVSFIGDAQAVADRLQAQDVRILERTNGTFALELPGPNQQQRILAAIDEAGGRLRGLFPKRSSLEEMFMAAITKQAEQKKLQEDAAP